MKRIFGAVLLVTIALAVPPAPAAAGQCIFCPQIAIECGDCYNLIPQTCNKCAYCKRIPGCHP